MQTGVEYTIPMLDGARLHREISDLLRAAFDRVLESGRYIGGDEVSGFEGLLAERLGVSEVVGTGSGTDALLVALSALGVRPGDEVVTTAYSFIAAAAAAARLGATPVFVDIDSESFNIDPDAVRDAITERTVGIVPVHLFGQCADTASILNTASARGLWVVEDTAQSIGATRNGRLAGTVADVGVFSFFPAKNLGALGDAGAAITNDVLLADKMRAVRNHGAVERYRHEILGGNHRLDALQAAFLGVKLSRLSAYQIARKRNADTYREALEAVGDLVLPTDRTDGGHVYNQFVLRTESRDRLRAVLREAGIETAVHYPLPVPLQPCFAYLGYKKGDFPRAERAAETSVALPMDPLLTEGELSRIVDAVRSAFS